MVIEFEAEFTGQWQGIGDFTLPPEVKLRVEQGRKYRLEYNEETGKGFLKDLALTEVPDRGGYAGAQQH